MTIFQPAKSDGVLFSVPPERTYSFAGWSFLHGGGICPRNRFDGRGGHIHPHSRSKSVCNAVLFVCNAVLKACGVFTLGDLEVYV